MASGSKPPGHLAATIGLAAAAWLAGFSHAPASRRSSFDKLRTNGSIVRAEPVEARTRGYDGNRSGADADLRPGAATPATPMRFVQVRALNRRARALLDDGVERSPTFRRLVVTLEAADTIVQITSAPLGPIPAKSVLLPKVSPVRIVRITLNSLPELFDHVLPWLAHELQHAVEIATDPGLTTNGQLEAYYHERGISPAPDMWCTIEAQRVAQAVAAELARPRR